jgi:hypothetical protein
MDVTVGKYSLPAGESTNTKRNRRLSLVFGVRGHAARQTRQALRPLT